MRELSEEWLGRMSRLQGLFFDFDGLILETEGPIYRSWLELYQSYGCALPFEAFAATIGTAENTVDLLALLEEQVGRPLPRQEVARRRARETELIAAEAVMPGVQEMVESARRLGLKRAVVSSSGRGWVVGHLERLGLMPAFDRVITGSEVQPSKPDPALYLAALQALDLRPEQALAFEDSPHGVRAAKSAGIWCVAVPTALTRDLNLGQADLRLDSLAGVELEGLLEKVINARPAANDRRPPIG